MNFCTKCGAQLTPGMKFCTSCGASVENTQEAQSDNQVVQENVQPAQVVQENVQPAQVVQEDVSAQPTNQISPENPDVQMPQEPKAPKKPVNKKLIMIIAIAVVVVAAIVVTIVLITSNAKKKREAAEALERKTINMNDYLEYSMSGYDSMGTASVSFADGFSDALFKAMGKKKETVNERVYMKAMAVLETTDFVLDKDINLSNGDTITVTLEYNEDAVEAADVIFEFEDVELTVEGLVPTKTVNPFDYLEVSQSGMNGYVSIELNKKNTEDWESTVYYNIDNSWNLSIGDEYTVSVDEYSVEQALNNYGVVLSETSKTYKVENAEHYITKLEDISEDLWDVVKDATEQKLKDSYDFYGKTLKSYTYAGSYLLTRKDEPAERSYLFNIYKGKIEFEDEDLKSVDVFIPVYVDDIREKEDGSQEMNDSYPEFYYTDNIYEDTYVQGFLEEEYMYEYILEYWGENYDIELTEGLVTFETELSEDDEKAATEAVDAFLKAINDMDATAYEEITVSEGLRKTYYEGEKAKTIAKNMKAYFDEDDYNTYSNMEVTLIKKNSAYNTLVVTNNFSSEEYGKPEFENIANITIDVEQYSSYWDSTDDISIYLTLYKEDGKWYVFDFYDSSIGWKL